MTVGTWSTAHACTYVQPDDAGTLHRVSYLSSHRGLCRIYLLGFWGTGMRGEAANTGTLSLAAQLSTRSLLFCPSTANTAQERVSGRQAAAVASSLVQPFQAVRRPAQEFGRNDPVGPYVGSQAIKWEYDLQSSLMQASPQVISYWADPSHPSSIFVIKPRHQPNLITQPFAEQKDRRRGCTENRSCR